MSHSNDEPQWLRSARAAWPNGSAPRGLDSTWSPYWIKKFLGYLERYGDRVNWWLGEGGEAR